MEVDLSLFNLHQVNIYHLHTPSLNRRAIAKYAARFDLDRGTKELEAEAVAYVISDHFGFQDPSSHNYLALWHADA